MEYWLLKKKNNQLANKGKEVLYNFGKKQSWLSVTKPLVAAATVSSMLTAFAGGPSRGSEDL